MHLYVYHFKASTQTELYVNTCTRHMPYAAQWDPVNPVTVWRISCMYVCVLQYVCMPSQALFTLPSTCST